MMTDSIADFLIRIKIAYAVGKQAVSMPFSNEKKNIASILEKEGYIEKSTIVADGAVKKHITIELLYVGNTPKIHGVSRISKPGKRVFVKKHAIPTVLGGLGTVILSTPEGIMGGREAKKKGVGGEIICKVW